MSKFKKNQKQEKFRKNKFTNSNMAKKNRAKNVRKTHNSSYHKKRNKHFKNFQESSENASASSTSVDSIEIDEKQIYLCKPNEFAGPTKILAIDCEMVGVGQGGHQNALARVSIVNYFGNVVYDEYVKTLERVTDYRSKISGIRPDNLLNAKEFFVVQDEVASLLKGRIIVGHSVIHDLKCLYLQHPRKSIRDTSKYGPFRKLNHGRTPSLKYLTQKLLKINIQEGEHDSVVDAQATMRLYAISRQQWEDGRAYRGPKAQKKKESESTSTE